MFYPSHHDLLKLHSESTHCHTVFNSFDHFRGHILNKNCTKCPHIFDNLLGILIRFQENFIALRADIKKMYHAVKMTKQDRHIYQFL